MHFTKTTIFHTLTALLLSAHLTSAASSLPDCPAKCIETIPVTFLCDDLPAGLDDAGCVCSAVSTSDQYYCVEDCALPDQKAYAMTLPPICRIDWGEALTDEEVEVVSEQMFSTDDWRTFVDGETIVELHGGKGGDGKDDSKGDSKDESGTDDEAEADAEGGADDDEGASDGDNSNNETANATREEEGEKDAAAGLVVPGFAVIGAGAMLALFF